MAKTAAAVARPTKDERAIAEANRLAALLAAAAPDAPGALAPPAFINDPRLAPALAVWRALAPVLTLTGRLHELDRSAFAALCYWQAEWIAAVDDIQTRGYSFMGRAVAGGSRPWINPSVNRRDRAWDQIMALSAKFGLTPLDRIALNKNRGMIADDELPFSAPRAEPAPVEAPASKWQQLLN